MKKHIVTGFISGVFLGVFVSWYSGCDILSRQPGNGEMVVRWLLAGALGGFFGALLCLLYSLPREVGE